jgi:hypothetical protein
MKKIFFSIFALLLFSSLVFMNCSSEEPTVPTYIPKSEAIGLWEGKMDLRPFGWDVNMSVFMDINGTDSTYLLHAVDDSSGVLDTIFWHQGNWTEANNIMYFQGIDCKKDSSDSLYDYDCGAAIPLTINIFKDDEDKIVWDLRIGDLEAAVMALGIVTQSEFDQLRELPFRMKKVS